eukprot:TRINITY_DN24451_c0_g1_i1.p1 TRINITY_DN24451_c0_g1~~TRINITY_DN24451_c0_g1_i1.p1  ORF type:complete len:514 (+),score=111.50 TRINITY_DN24451_c0_g1_i1:22-1542(+)
MTSNFGLVLGGESGKKPVTDPRWRLNRNLTRMHDLLGRVVKENMTEVKQIVKKQVSENKKYDLNNKRRRLSTMMTESKEKATFMLKAMVESKIGLSCWGMILQESGSAVRQYFNDESNLAAWFPQFTPQNIADNTNGTNTLKNFLLSERNEVWSQIVWKEDCIGHAPPTVSTNPLMMTDVDVPATLKKIKAELLTSRSFEVSLKTGVLVAKDPNYFITSTIDKISDSKTGTLLGTTFTSAVKNAIWEYIHSTTWEDLIATISWEEQELQFLLDGRDEDDLNISLLNLMLSSSNLIIKLVQITKQSSLWKPLLTLLRSHFSTATVSYDDTVAISRLKKEIERGTTESDKSSLPSAILLQLIEFRSVAIASAISLRELTAILDKEHISYSIVEEDGDLPVPNSDCEDPMAAYIKEQRKSDKKARKEKKKNKKRSKDDDKSPKKSKPSTDNDDPNDNTNKEEVVEKVISGIQLSPTSKITRFDLPLWVQSAFTKSNSISSTRNDRTKRG